MANMKVAGPQQTQSVENNQPKKAADAVKGHLNKLQKTGLGEEGNAILKGAALGAAAAIVLPLPGGIALGAAAGAAVAKAVDAAQDKKATQAFAKKATKGIRPDAARQAKPLSEEDSAKLKSAARTAGAAVIGGIALGLPGIALGAFLASEFVSDKAKDAWNSMGDFMSKNADKMVAKTPGDSE